MNYSWSFSNEKNRGTSWYLIAITVMIAFVIWGFISKIYMMSISILLVSGLYFFSENNANDETNIEISDLGIKVDSNFFDFSKISSYSLIYEDDKAIILRLKLISKGFKILDLKIDNEITKDLKAILPSYIEEDPKEDLTTIEKIIRLLKL
ncbi:MAG: hypothetical protein PHR68_05035 [Candidatus Gracilibacteria bacterium]|nr:hypothetical protein [Candidatus Gracilibacteria bacterium]